MGASNGGIAIKTDTSKIDLLKVAKNIFGSDFEKSGSYCDSRKSDCAYIGKTKDFLVIVNSDFVDTFFTNKGTERMQNCLDYFSKPDFVFAFEEYDSGGTYGYSLIYNGIVKRQFRSVLYETQTDFGELEPVELKWKKASVTKENLGDGEYQLVYKDPAKDFTCAQEQLSQVILQELMHEKLGFSSWNMDEFIIEQGHYKKTPRIQSEQMKEGDIALTESTKRPWWKFW